MEYNQKKILIIEDEEDIAEILQFNLENESYDVSVVHSGEKGLEHIIKYKPDLVLLDLMLPGLSGLDVCKNVRRNNALLNVKIIILTAKGEEIDIVTGLELGADDYVTKPFSLRVLISRIKNVLQRRTAAPVDSDEISFDDFRIVHNKREVYAGDKLVKLTSSEFKTLAFLAKHPGWIYTRYQITDAVHGDGYPSTDRAIDVMIVSLRKKLGTHSHLVETVRGVGYRFKEI
jgi:two-component system, OmpR family, alkaline phosphatase synthesis response regulator PhoP